MCGIIGYIGYRIAAHSFEKGAERSGIPLGLAGIATWGGWQNRPHSL